MLGLSYKIWSHESRLFAPVTADISKKVLHYWVTKPPLTAMLVKSSHWPIFINRFDWLLSTNKGTNINLGFISIKYTRLKVLPAWRQRHQATLKHWYLPTELHVSQMSVNKCVCSTVTTKFIRSKWSGYLHMGDRMLCEALHNHTINLFLNGFNVQPYFVWEDLLLVWQENKQTHLVTKKKKYQLSPFSHCKN